MINKKLIIILLLLNLNNLYSNVVYDKNNIVVTDIEIDQFKILYKEYYDLELNSSQILKKIILNKNLIDQIKAQNIDYYEYLNSIINDNLNNKILSQTEIYFYQNYFLRREFIIEYFKNNLSLADIEETLSNFDLKIPVSLNDCVTITNTVNLQKNKEFIKFIYESIKNINANNEIIIQDNLYSICITNNINQLIEKNLIKTLEIKTEQSFKKFTYEKIYKK